MTDYTAVAQMMNEIAVLKNAKSVLYWDQVMDLPKGGSSFRSQQLALLTRLIKEKSNSSELWDLVNRSLESPNGLSHLEIRDLKEVQEELKRTRAVPIELAVQIAKAESLGEQTWEQARTKGDMEAFFSVLRPLVNLKKEEASHTHPDLSAYNGLIDTFNPGMSTESIDPLFRKLKAGLKDIMQKLDLTKNSQVDSFKLRHFSVSRQKILCQQLIDDLGFDANNRCVKESTHPFSITLGPDDYRITTRYSPDKMFDSFLSLAHEMGHSLYDEGINNAQLHGMPRSNSHNLAIHESHSLFWENRVICGKPYLEKYYHSFKNSFPEALEGCTWKDFSFLTRGVDPSFIRVEADELTYCLHIIVRYETEKALFADRIRVDDIPEFWANQFQELLGVKPVKVQDGCLQDIHWSGGAFGYFPSYALGHLISAQVSEKLEAELGHSLEESFTEPKQIHTWLKENCYQLPGYLTVEEYVKEVTGKRLSAEPFLEYLDRKYSDIYRI